MDITSLFKAKFEIVKNRSKALGDVGPNQTRSKIFPTKKTEYYSKARELVATITSLKTFLHENRPLYLQADASLSLTHENPDCMTEMQKDEMDVNVYKIIQNCQGRIQAIESLVQAQDITLNTQPQLRTHVDNVLNSIREYIKDVSALYSEMRAIRVRRSVSIQTIAKLNPTNTTKVTHRAKNDNQMAFVNSQMSSKVSREFDEHVQEKEIKVPSHLTHYLDDDEEILSPEEVQMLEQENRELLNQLHSIADEVDQIQSNVVSIAQLQSVFTEKVLEQHKDIESVATAVISATENVKGGNEQIRQAIQQNADFRAWVLFFIIVMSLSLLFLDWYND